MRAYVFSNFPTSGKIVFISLHNVRIQLTVMEIEERTLEISDYCHALILTGPAKRIISKKSITKIELLPKGSSLSPVLAMSILLIHLVLFHFSSIVAYGGDEPADSLPPIIINEIEINASSDQNRLRWIELLNAGDVQVSVSKLNLNVIVSGIDGNNTTHVWLTPDDYEDDTESFTLAARDHYVVNIPIMLDLFDANLITLQLFQDQVLLDEVEGINDNVADDRTWQRFPDGQDIGYFEDWIFTDATKGEHNGNMGQVIAECYLNPLCMSINIPMHKPEIINVNGTTFTIDTLSTSLVTDLNLDQNQKKISVKLSESHRDSGLSFIHLTLPKLLLGGDYLVNIDNETSQQSFFTVDNSTHSRLVIEYQPGDRSIEVVGTSVIPEFNGGSALMTAAAITSVLLFFVLSRKAASVQS